MYEINLEYDHYKSHVLDSADKDFNYQHVDVTVSSVKSYFLFAPDGEQVVYTCRINDASTGGAADVLDYENNYASGGNKKLHKEDFRSEKYRRKIESTSGDVTKACTSTEWTEFYDIDFGSEKKYFSEFVYKCDNLAKIRIRIGDDNVLQGTLNDLKKVIVDDDGIIMKDIDVSYVNNIATVFIDLNYQRGSRIRVLQQRRSGTGDLTAKGYLLSYVERK